MVCVAMGGGSQTADTGQCGWISCKFLFVRCHQSLWGLYSQGKLVVFGVFPDKLDVSNTSFKFTTDGPCEGVK